MVHVALLLLMLEAADADLVSTISLKRNTPNLQLSTSGPADYPIYQRRRRTRTTRRARFGLASSTCSVLSKPHRAVGLYGRSASCGRKPRSACRTSPTTSAGS